MIPIFELINKHKFLFRIYYLILLLITSCILISLIFSSNLYYKVTASNTSPIKIDEKQILDIYIDDLYSVNTLQKMKVISDFRVEQVRKTKIVPNISVAKLPKDLKTIKSIKNRKEIFLKITLPLIAQENQKLLLINKRLNAIKSRFNSISRKEALWVKDLMREYEETSIDQLLIKVDEIPVSLALAQAVIESGWGTSRFAYEGNALFGQYVWGKTKNGIVPSERETDAKYKIKSFDNLGESVASYMKNLNTNFHYSEFRINRYVLRTNKLSLRGIDLAEYMFNYSIEDDYIAKIKNIIEINDFEDFEDLNLEKGLPSVTEII